MRGQRNRLDGLQQQLFGPKDAHNFLRVVLARANSVFPPTHSRFVFRLARPFSRSLFGVVRRHPLFVFIFYFFSRLGTRIAFEMVMYGARERLVGAVVFDVGE